MSVMEWKDADLYSVSPQEQLRRRRELREKFFARRVPVLLPSVVSEPELEPEPEQTPKPIQQEPGIHPISVVQKVVARHYGISIRTMRSTCRWAKVTYARQVAMRVCKVINPEWSLHTIGIQFGRRDHTTVMHAINKIGRLELANANLAADVALLVAQSKEALAQ